MYPFILKLEYWDDYETPWVKRHMHILLYAESMAAAVAKAEESNYVDNLETVKVMSVADSGTFFEVPGHIAKILIAGAGNYRQGLEELDSTTVRDKLHEDAERIHRNFMKEDENELDA